MFKSYNYLQPLLYARSSIYSNSVQKEEKLFLNLMHTTRNIKTVVNVTLPYFPSLELLFQSF